MARFAHLADCHIGAWRDEKLRELNLQAFEQAIDKCVEEKADCILISGDLFDTGMPNFTQAIRAVVKLKQAEKTGIRVYVVYGSHDYSPNATSLIDLLQGTELFTKVSEGEIEEDKLRMKVFEDKPTGVRIVGISGRRIGLEKESYEALDRESLEVIKAPKIFMFHTTVTELNPGLPIGSTVPASLFPRGFTYYAGGNIHKPICENIEYYGPFAYPGPTFGADFSDLENIAKGDKRGFYIMEIEGSDAKLRFVELDLPKIEYHEVDADEKTPGQVQERLGQLASTVDSKDKIILIRVMGQLSTGKTADVNTAAVTQALLSKGARFVSVNKNALTTAERLQIKIRGVTKEEIEQQIFAQSLAEFSVEPTLESGARRQLEKKLIAEGAQLAHSLLSSMRDEKKEEETENDFAARVVAEARHLFELEESG